MSADKDDKKKEGMLKGFARKTFNGLRRMSIRLRQGSLDKALVAAFSSHRALTLRRTATSRFALPPNTRTWASCASF